MSKSPIHINPAHKGEFTMKANAAGKSVQAFASEVLSNPNHYHGATVKQANFAKNAKKFKH